VRQFWSKIVAGMAACFFCAGSGFASDQGMIFAEHISHLEFMIAHCEAAPQLDQKKLAAIREDWAKMVDKKGYYDDGTETTLGKYYEDSLGLVELIYDDNPQQMCRVLPDMIKNNLHGFPHPFVKLAN
jgi:hypothetical protein